VRWRTRCPAPSTNGYAISVTVTSDPKRNGEQAGLLLYVDDDSYIKVVREFFQDQLQLIQAYESILAVTHEVVGTIHLAQNGREGIANLSF
jgi:regulation of enolase protein 1 (concanavalin A-like superfamily)